MTVFHVHMTFESGGTQVASVKHDDADGPAPSLEAFSNKISDLLSDEDNVLSFQKPTNDGVPGFVLVPVRALAKVHVY